LENIPSLKKERNSFFKYTAKTLHTQENVTPILTTGLCSYLLNARLHSAKE